MINALILLSLLAAPPSLLLPASVKPDMGRPSRPWVLASLGLCLWIAEPVTVRGLWTSVMVSGFWYRVSIRWGGWVAHTCSLWY